MASRGIDVSHHQGTINWSKVKAASIDFAIIRAGYGLIEDRCFKANVEGAISAGMPVGIYYFSYALNAEQAKREAEHCIKLIKPYRIALPVYYDFEYATEDYAKQKGVSYTKALRTAIHVAFLEQIKAAGYRPGVYTNVDYIKTKLNWGDLSGYSFWLAQWPLGDGRAIRFEEVKESAVNTAFGKPDVWQIGKGRVDGIVTDVDLNYGYLQLLDKQPAAKPAQSITAGDKVRVKNYTVSGGKKRGKVYGGAGTFVVYYEKYDVISVTGDRVVIGIGKVVTAAVHIDDLEKC